MNIKKLGLIGATLLLAAPMWASTYYGGFEDTKGGDYDYNDLVFSLSGTNLTLNSAANWYAKPTLGTSGTPFWNNASGDAPSATMNVGYCVYGGGGCNGGVGLDPTASYLAANNTKTGSANDVSFSVTGTVGTSVTLTISADKDQLGWYSLSSPGALHWLNTSGSTGSFTFTPGGSFGLVGNNGLGNTYYSQTSVGGTVDIASHFAFFGNPTPEPGMTGLMAAGLLAVGTMFRRRRAAKQ